MGNNIENENCKCGIDYKTWIDYDVQCIDDDLHLWEEGEEVCGQ
jgi:hypothetical protein